MDNRGCEDYHDSMSSKERKTVDSAVRAIASVEKTSWPPSTDAIRIAMGQAGQAITTNQINSRVQMEWSETKRGDIRRS